VRSSRAGAGNHPSSSPRPGQALPSPIPHAAPRPSPTPALFTHHAKPASGLIPAHARPLAGHSSISRPLLSIPYPSLSTRTIDLRAPGLCNRTPRWRTDSAISAQWHASALCGGSRCVTIIRHRGYIRNSYPCRRSCKRCGRTTEASCTRGR
jgi:hypothetical protein